MPEAYPPAPTPPPRRDPPPGALPLGRGAWVLPGALRWTFTTARGPGGQHVNKASTAAVLRVEIADIGGLDEAAVERLRAMAASALVSDEAALQFRCDLHRSQLQNRDACEARLRALVSQAAVRPKVRKKTRPTRGSIERRLSGKKRDSQKKDQRRWKDD
ncbi:MAG: alternative ribosome rescue aminoacyl-tRNA hydrolase ArfB [Phycisphaerales bacterium]